MVSIILFQISIFLLLLTLVAFFFGEYMAKVFIGERTLLSPIILPLENLCYKICGIDPEEQMTWTTFALNLFWLLLIGTITVFLLIYFQDSLPWGTGGINKPSFDSILNTTISFVTNTNWHADTGATSYLSRMLGLGVQNFLASALSIVIAIALINAFIKKNTTSLGNFWVYLIRTIFYILLPLSCVLGLFFIAQGTPNNLNPPLQVQTLEGQKQIIAQGPIASQIAIKQLGTSGGGFFIANSAHPYENPTSLTDLISILACLLIAAAFPFTFGAMLKDRAQGWLIFVTMLFLFCLGLGLALWTEGQGSTLLAKLGIEQGTNLEGKEARLGVISSVIFANAATATATGASSSAYISFMPLTKLILMLNMSLGEITFGGAGSGFIGMLFYVIFAIFIIGLMIGRSAEVYGKKLGTREILLVAIALFLPCILQFTLSCIAIILDSHLLDNITNAAHRLYTILYAYLSVFNNNGSMLAGLNFNTRFYNLSTALAMYAGFMLRNIIALAIAGLLVQKNRTPQVAHFPTTSFLFVLVLIAVILFIGISTFIPSLITGLILEHLRFFVGSGG